MSDSRTPAEIEADIVRQRDQLAQTVDQLAHKLDVKAQAKERASQVADRATTDDGKPRPELVAAALTVVLLVGALVWRRRR
jgi:MYXO-CTERM domain-containing protein